MISEDDIERVAAACQALPDPPASNRKEDFLISLFVTVLDFQMRTTTVERAMQTFRQEPATAVRDVDDLREAMARWPASKDGNTELAQFLWGYNLWTRAQMLRDLVDFFDSIGVTTAKGLRKWARTATFADFDGKVHGLGRAVFQSLVMRQGVDTVKPDVHVHRFVSAVLGRKLNDTDLVEVVTGAAKRLGRSAANLDWAIWDASRQRDRA